jgi:hypothetical protein
VGAGIAGRLRVPGPGSRDGRGFGPRAAGLGGPGARRVRRMRARPGAPERGGPSRCGRSLGPGPMRPGVRIRATGPGCPGPPCSPFGGHGDQKGCSCSGARRIRHRGSTNVTPSPRPCHEAGLPKACVRRPTSPCKLWSRYSGTKACSSDRGVVEHARNSGLRGGRRNSSRFRRETSGARPHSVLASSELPRDPPVPGRLGGGLSQPGPHPRRPGRLSSVRDGAKHGVPRRRPEAASSRGASRSATRAPRPEPHARRFPRRSACDGSVAAS